MRNLKEGENCEKKIFFHFPFQRNKELEILHPDSQSADPLVIFSSSHPLAIELQLVRYNVWTSIGEVQCWSSFYLFIHIFNMKLSQVLQVEDPGATVPLQSHKKEFQPRLQQAWHYIRRDLRLCKCCCFSRLIWFAKPRPWLEELLRTKLSCNNHPKRKDINRYVTPYIYQYA